MAIGAFFEGFESIATNTLNLFHGSEAKVQVKRNLCGYIPLTIEIIDVNCGNNFLNPSKVVKGKLLVKNFWAFMEEACSDGTQLVRQTLAYVVPRSVFLDLGCV